MEWKVSRMASTIKKINNTIITVSWTSARKYCSRSKYWSSAFEVNIEDNIISTNQRNSCCRIYCQKVEDKKKWRHFAMASLYQDMASQCNGCVTVCKSFINKDVYFRFLPLLFIYIYKQSCLFLDNGLYRKTLVCLKGLLSQWYCRLSVRTFS